MKSLAPLAALLLLGLGTASWLARPDPPGVRAPLEPTQVMLAAAEAPDFTRAGWSIHALATYDITARLLHKKRYYGGPTANGPAGYLAPYDFAVGWGLMSDSAILRQLTISQGNRFFFFEYRDHPPAPLDQMERCAANMHLIPASGAVQRALWWAAPGDVVRLTGYLVQAQYPGCNLWKSSLSRTDTGNGACELMYVQSCEFLPAPPPRAQPLKDPTGLLGDQGS